MNIEINLPETLEFTIAGETHTIRAEDLSPDALVGLLMYGRRKANDTFNSAKGGDSPLTAEQVIEKIRKWDFGSSGPRVDAYTKALRDVVKEYLTVAGFKGKDATAEAKNPQKGFETALTHILAAKDGIPVSQVNGNDVIAAMDKNWPKVEAKARKIVEVAKVATDLDI